MAYERNKPVWAKGVPGAGEDVNAPLGAWISAERLNHMEDGIEAIDKELTALLQDYKPDLDKTAIASIVSFPFSADFAADGGSVTFGNVLLDVMTQNGPFKIDIPAGSLDFQHGMKICIDNSTRALEQIFIQADWPSINDSTVWAIGTMQQNAIVVNGTATQRKILSFFSGASLVRDFT